MRSRIVDGEVTAKFGGKHFPAKFAPRLVISMSTQNSSPKTCTAGTFQDPTVPQISAQFPLCSHFRRVPRNQRAKTATVRRILPQENLRRATSERKTRAEATAPPFQLGRRCVKRDSPLCPVLRNLISHFFLVSPHSPFSLRAFCVLTVHSAFLYLSRPRPRGVGPFADSRQNQGK